MIRTLKKTPRIPLATVALVFSIAMVASAQWDPYPWKRVPRTADGKVDLNAPAQRTRLRQARSFRLLDAGKSHQAPAEPRRRPEARRCAAQAMGAAISTMSASKTTARIIPGVSCLPSGIPEKDNIPDGLKLVQTEDLVLFLHESRTIYRQIFTDGRPLPKNPQPTWMGYSIGHWDKDTFVVETIGQNGKTWLDMRGLPGTEALRVTERFSRPKIGHMDIEVTIDDPEAYTKPWTVKLAWTPATGYRSDREHLRREQPGPGHMVGK